MSLFSEIEKTIERGFRHWTERAFGLANSDQLLLAHRAILEEIETKVQTVARGRRVFPYASVMVTMVSPDADRRALYQAALGEQLQSDIRASLESAQCQVPRGFTVEVRTAEAGPRAFEIEYGMEPRQVEKPAPQPLAPARLVVARGKAESAEYALDKPRTNIGRLAELTDAEHRVVRRNDIVFEEGADEANVTVSRSHAHIRKEAGDYRICDDGSEYGTRIFREGRSIETPAGNHRGEKLRSGDEIYIGRACLRFEQ